MAINNIGERNFIKDLSGSRYTETARKKPSDAPRETTRDDTVSLSNGLKDMQIARDAVNAAEFNPANSDSGREEKVSRLRAMYLSDQYHVNPDEVAAKLIGTHFREIV